MDFSELRDKKALIVVSSGGHLLEALHIARKFHLSDQSIYVSHENPQSFSLLQDKPHYFIPNVRSRDWKGMLKSIPRLLKISAREDFELIISTGAAIAISAVPIKYLRMKPYFFFDSITRLEAPSMTGRILEFFPFIKRFSEHAENFGPKWRISPSILENFAPETRVTSGKPLRILITLGTIPNYRFDRLIDSLLTIIDVRDEIYWQIGCTSREDLPGSTFTTIPNNEMIQIAKSCDVVVSHCGIGTILDLLTLGIRPLVLPRQSIFGEHVDNHQEEAANMFVGLDLIQILSDSPSREELFSAASRYIGTAPST
jgi:UDP-N-acetylglucosamine transferase subunit ALG13